jgi:beta-glucosidase
MGSWRIAADDESAVSVLKDFKSMKEINLTMSKELISGRTQFVWETKNNMTDKVAFLKLKQADVDNGIRRTRLAIWRRKK